MSLTVPTYIRSEDTEKYLKIKESQRGAWTEFIHNALNPGPLDGFPKEILDKVDSSTTEITGRVKPIKTKQDAEKVIKSKGWSGPISKSFSARKKG